MTSPEATAIREHIMQEASRLFVSRGYHGISMREIAQVVGLSKPGIYYHFKDKEDLFLAILIANLDHIGSITRQARHEGATAHDQISRLLRALFAQAPEQQAIIRLASQEIVHLSQAARLEFSRLYQAEFIGQIEDILRSGIERGDLRPMDVRLAAWILLGMAYPFLYPAHERELGPPEEAIELMLTIFLQGAARL